MTLSLPIAFLAGILSFLSPCVLPLVPTYLLYLGGQQGRPLKNALFFVLGFSAIFFLLGLPFTLLGGLLFEYRDLLGRVGGVVLVLLGLYMLGLKPRWGVNLRYEGPTDRPWGAFVLGVVLGLGWTPCIGPILGGILTLTATGEGVHLLVAYILGLAVPFLLVALFADRARAFLRRAARFSHAVEILAGVVLIAVGLLLLTGTYTQLNSFFLRITPEWLQERL
ncbi:MAG: cytochrome c biogenesis CcdA family protein [Meiothermus sp.]|uniref:cytochrome c biogenesis CcdA family protein n=1 Tax=Meiothermus sp. TaxID=1955249 RepID=UPI0025D49D46|nr:cytochrome c biogenesis CcdA family protein [Meiothermus sp.]MCS7058839.1 cytochrome c biogenesis CcdA family protein [Meiothermus sp.]MCS7194061.1 cytochrome c biogenesis CcdA family protein [Meiothermus sp.]MCX7740432.1 cytochrome c biogenesis CcdA family protein [Meiothermus sp.]MDW8091164.1 cytochrome c biogenesis CcdA family protein [Meiothermus sp.]MDW8480459.1 cytochrome c biogenesis CcdA family protein [Meiothermus sp.]